MRRAKLPRHIAPRLRSGDLRESIGHGLPPQIKNALKMIAHTRNESVSWMLEQALIEYFDYTSPEYMERKRPKPDTPEKPAPPRVAAKAAVKTKPRRSTDDPFDE